MEIKRSVPSVDARGAPVLQGPPDGLGQEGSLEPVRLQEPQESKTGERLGAEQLLPTGPNTGHADGRHARRGRLDEGVVAPHADKCVERAERAGKTRDERAKGDPRLCREPAEALGLLRTALGSGDDYGVPRPTGHRLDERREQGEAVLPTSRCGEHERTGSWSSNELFRTLVGSGRFARRPEDVATEGRHGRHEVRESVLSYRIEDVGL